MNLKSAFIISLTILPFIIQAQAKNKNSGRPVFFPADSTIDQKYVSVFLGNDEKTHGLLSGSFESTL